MRLGWGHWPRGLWLGLLVAITAGLGACTPWPEYATGGMAERHPTTSADILALEARCDALSHGGADLFLPGRMADARLMLQRARREVAGELEADAGQTLTRADMLITAIEHDMSRRRPGGRRAGS